MQSSAPTVAAYLASLPADRRVEIEKVRSVILKNIDRGFAETMQYGMIGYNVPHSAFPAGYHCDPKQPLPYAGLANQKSAMSLYIMGLYWGGEEAKPSQTAKWFHDAWTRSGKKLDMGKCCIRFRKADDLALDVIGEAFKRIRMQEYIDFYVGNLPDKVKAKMLKSEAGPTSTSPSTSTSKKASTMAAPKKNTAKNASKKVAKR
jgi:hypothetical protein